MKNLSIADLRLWEPCYDPSRYFSEDWQGTAIDILRDDRIPHEDRLWAVLRTEFVTERTMRLFAVWCARQVQHLMTDPRSLNALDVAERFANGKATDEELTAARAYARAAARDAARDAAWDAAQDAARTAAQDAAWTAARAYARATAYDAAEATAQAAQRAKLIEMIEAENKKEE
jgi:hypothetical protein